MQTHAFYASQGNKETYIYIYTWNTWNICGICGICRICRIYWCKPWLRGSMWTRSLTLALPGAALARLRAAFFSFALAATFSFALVFSFFTLDLRIPKVEKLPRRRLAFPIAALALLLPDVFVCFFELLRPWSTLLQKSNMENIILQSSLLYSSLCDCIALYCIVLYCIV